MAESLLPAPLASDPSLLALEGQMERLSDLDLLPLLPLLVDAVDASALPHLAYQFSLLDEAAWSLAESDEQRRALLAGAVAWHRRKGTPWAVRELCRLLGFGEITIEEGIYPRRLDGSWTLDGTASLDGGAGGWQLDGGTALDGSRVLGQSGNWAQYRIGLAAPITGGQAELLRGALEHVAPARCELAGFTYPRAVFRLNGEYLLDGSHHLTIEE